MYKLGSRLNERRDATGAPSLLPHDMVVVSVKATLRRFLKARDIDVDRAYDMIANTIEWRDENEMDRILDEPLDEGIFRLIVERYPGYYCGFDKDGYPVYYEWTPGVQWLELLDRLGFAESIRLHYKLMEFQSRVLCLRATNRVSEPNSPATNVRDKFVHVLDMHALSLSLLWDKRITEVLSHVSKIDQDHYPELLRRAYIINAPFAFKAAFAIVKPFLSKSTQEKIRVLGSKQESLDAVKLALGDDANLPSLMYHRPAGDASPGSGAGASTEARGSEPTNAVALLQEFLRHRKRRLEERRRKETAAMMEEVADPLLTPTQSYETLMRRASDTDDDGDDGVDDDVEENEAKIRGEDDTYQTLVSAALLSSERSFRVMVKVNEVARSTSEHMAIHAPCILEGHLPEGVAPSSRPSGALPTIDELMKEVGLQSSASSAAWDDPATASDAAAVGAHSRVELSSAQSAASVLLLLQFCQQSAILYGIYGAQLMLAALAPAYATMSGSSSPSSVSSGDASLITIVLGVIGGGGQVMLAYHVHAAAQEFHGAYMDRHTHWHIELGGMVRRVCVPGVCREGERVWRVGDDGRGRPHALRE